MEKIIKELKTKEFKSKKEVFDYLKKNKLNYNDVTEDYGYFNIRIPLKNNGYIRIYQDRRKDFNVQIFTPVQLSYSGIPTFNPSGVNNLNTML